MLDISPENPIFLKTFDSEFSYIDLWFTYQNKCQNKRQNKYHLSY